MYKHKLKPCVEMGQTFYFQKANIKMRGYVYTQRIMNNEYACPPPKMKFKQNIPFLRSL